MPAPKAPTNILMHWNSPVLPNIDTSAFFNNRKTNHPAISLDDKTHYDEQIKRAISFYVKETKIQKLEMLDSTVVKFDPRSATTLTERKKAISRIIKAASQLKKISNDKSLLEKPSKLNKDLSNLDEALHELELAYSEIDFGSKFFFKKTLKIREEDFFQMHANFRFQLMRPVPENSNILLDKIIGFEIPNTANRTGGASPELFALITILVPIWKITTGRAFRRTNSSSKNISKIDGISSDTKRYLFAETVRNIIRQANPKGFCPSLDQIDKLCQKLKL